MTDTTDEEKPKRTANIYFQVLKFHADSIQKMYGVRWVPQPHHFKLCKQLMQSEVEGFDPYTPEEIIERLEAYYKETWWKTVRHDFANFCKHFDKFIVTRDERTVGHQSQPIAIGEAIGNVLRFDSTQQVIHCTRCGQNHRASDDCEQQRKAE